MTSLKAVSLLTLSGVLALTSFASAQTITVPNGSFEDPAAAGDYFQTNINNSTFVPDFTFNDSSSVSGTLANRFAGTGNPGTSEGSRVAFFNLGPGLSGTATTNSAVTTIVAGMNYTFTAALGNTPGTGNYSEPGTFSLSLGTGSSTAFVPLATLLVDANSVVNGLPGATAIPDGTIEDFSVTLTAAQAAAFAGQGLFLQVGATDTLTSGDFSQPLFDNLRLTETPEPSTWAMLLGSLGLAGFLSFRRAKV